MTLGDARAMPRRMDDIKEQQRRALHAYAQESLEQISKSRIFLPLWTENYAADPYAVMQLGMAILADKPLYILLQRGQSLPDTIRRIARKVVEFDKGDDAALRKAAQQLITEAKLG